MADIKNRSLTLADCRFDWVYHGYDKMFEGKATFSDIDGAVYHNDSFLFIELKSMKPGDDTPELFGGQLRLYEALSKQPNTTCLLVAGDMKTSVPYYVKNIGTGEELFLPIDDDLSARTQLRAIFASWWSNVNNQEGKS